MISIHKANYFPHSYKKHLNMEERFFIIIR